MRSHSLIYPRIFGRLNEFALFDTPDQVIRGVFLTPYKIQKETLMIVNVTLSFEFDEEFEVNPAAIANHLVAMLSQEEYKHRNCCISALMPGEETPFVRELTVDCENAVAIAKRCCEAQIANGWQLGTIKYAEDESNNEDEIE